ncbi:Cysteine/O-acetylserine efflux protein [Klebsiella spallanzanii]|uniref:Cysteine/O-acetylserine efflux protein n=1 Tax=Klebsiella spallanzanii TaxID=2587528 RepID=A0A564P219_9ENTR|nr:cysteine/O-acetylserine transporter [Klebsiella spallanzanii]MDM4208941.1 cysteine/O-acetylserine transporter [Klebsiella spallanzanii]VUS91164.1 Cysteine/O-acetylserine efflux protein [Klebsiella spallanzanii]VUT12085.1 Cysteine/O-acetylserine efflux protein [Klebsiella spallanzanii]
MTPTLISAFLTYTLITALTPGPNNILALSSVASHGLRQSMFVLAGMSVGFIITMLICAGLTLSLVTLDGGLSRALGWVGAAYILWLAWQIAKSKPTNSELSDRPLSFWMSLGLQFVNVKIILYGVTALSTFVLPVTREPVWLVSVSLLLAAIGTFGNVCWALAGHLFQRLFLHYGRQVNWFLAVLLVYCAGRILFE